MLRASFPVDDAVAVAASSFYIAHRPLSAQKIQDRLIQINFEPTYCTCTNASVHMYIHAREHVLKYVHKSVMASLDRE